MTGRHHQVTDDGVEFSVDGQGPPVVLIAGWGQPAAVWMGVLPRLTGRFSCITLDNRGLDTVGDRREPVTISGMGDDVAAAVRAAGLGPAAVLGWSMGGAVAQDVAHRHPDVVSALVLLSTSARRTSVQRLWTRARLALADADVEAEAVEAAALPWMFSPAVCSDGERVLNLARANAAGAAAGARGLRAQAMALDAFDARDWLPQLSVPTLVLVGVEDILTPVDLAIELATSIPAAHLKILPKGGHAVILEQTHEVLSAVTRFLRSAVGTQEAGGTAPSARPEGGL
jgi:3-oxoadipate enol-lactonase